MGKSGVAVGAPRRPRFLQLYYYTVILGTFAREYGNNNECDASGKCGKQQSFII